MTIVREHKALSGRTEPECHSPLLSAIAKTLCKSIGFCTVNAHTLGEEKLDLPGGYLFVCNHFSHIDPVILSVFHHRHIDWMTRVEFFKFRWSTWLIRHLGGFPVNRRGVPVSTIRTAIVRLRQGRIVGIFPEGGVVADTDSVCHGGAIKQGACLLSCRTGLPILPCILLGTRSLQRVGPWLPFRRAHLWIAVGDPILPPTTISSRRLARQAQAIELQRRFRDLYEQLTTLYAVNKQLV